MSKIKKCIFLLIIVFAAYACCDQGTYIIEQINVEPYDLQNKRVSSVIDSAISFQFNFSIEKHKNGRIRFDLIPTANATPPCKEYESEIPLKSFKIYTNRKIFYAPYEKEELQFYREPIKPYTYLHDLPFSKSYKYKKPNTTLEFNEIYKSTQENQYHFMDYQGSNMIDNLKTEYFSFKNNYIFPSGKYKFWFEWEYWDNQTFKDSVELVLESPIGDLSEDDTIKRNNNNEISLIIFPKNSLDTSKYLKRIFYQNNNIKEQSIYVNKKLQEEYITYFENGEVKEIYDYEYGKKNGYFKSFYLNGSVKSFGEYEQDHKKSFWGFYDEKGNKTEEIYYGNNEFIENRTTYKDNQIYTLDRWNKNYKIEETKYISTKEKVSKIWNSKGNIIYESRLRVDSVTNTNYVVGETYNDTGKIIQKDFYYDGKLIKSNKY